MKKIAWLCSGGANTPDPEDQFRAFAPRDLSPRAREELATMREQCAKAGQDKPQPTDKKPASLDER